MFSGHKTFMERKVSSRFLVLTTCQKLSVLWIIIYVQCNKIGTHDLKHRKFVMKSGITIIRCTCVFVCVYFK